MDATWPELCDMWANEPRKDKIVNIKIQLHSGLRIEGPISLEDAKQIFREPHNLLPIERNWRPGEVVIVLPSQKVDKVGVSQT